MANGAQNGIMGDDSFGTDLPQTQLPDEQLQAEKKMAKFVKSKEFIALTEYLQTRIEHYQKFLPNGQPVEAAPSQELLQNWVIANTVIGEFNAVINAYQQTEEVVNGR